MRKNIKTMLLAGSLAGTLALAACGGDDSGSGDGDDAKTLNSSATPCSSRPTPASSRPSRPPTPARTSSSRSPTAPPATRAAPSRPARTPTRSTSPSSPTCTRLVDAGLVADDWKDNDTKGICTTSVVVMVVRTGNPKGIADLGRPGQARRRHRHAQPRLLRLRQVEPARGLRLTCSPTAAARPTPQAYMKTSSATSWRCPTAAATPPPPSTSGNGDVLLSYENEAILARQSGDGLRLRHPRRDAAHREPVRASTEDASDDGPGVPGLPEERGGPEAVRRDRLPPAGRRRRPRGRGRQRPGDPFPEPETLQTIDGDFGGWAEANTKYFDENDGILTKIQAEAGQ